MADNNSVIIDKVFKGTNAYQLGAPNPTQVGIAKSMRWINDPMNSEWRMKTFIPQLFALIGTQIVHSKEWTNPLAQFKRANISNMKAIEEIMARLIKGRTYMQEMQGNLLEYNPPEVETAIHTVNRKVQYPITYNPQELENAFLSEQGLSNFFTAVMQVPINSDNRDEYEMMKDLIAKYQDKWGFYMVSVSEHSPEEATKDDIMNLLENIRAYADKLKFYTGLYNAYKMEVFTPKDQLLVMMTPEVKAKMDVQALAAAFNVAFAEIESRIILVDEMPIQDCYALLMDENWFVCGDALLQTTNFFNGATLNTNYWLHHWEVLSMSPMMNAIAFMKNSATQVETVTVTPRAYSIEHKISSAPFLQNGMSKDLLVDAEDNSGINSSEDYISYDENVAPQRYHALNGLLFFNANPNLPDLPIEEFRGNYVFKPSTFEPGNLRARAYTLADNDTLPKWDITRICDCYEPGHAGNIVTMQNIVGEEGRMFLTASLLLQNLEAAIEMKQYDMVKSLINSNVNYKSMAESWNSKVKLYVGFTDNTKTKIRVSTDIQHQMYGVSETIYEYDPTTHALGNVDEAGTWEIGIPHGDDFEDMLAAQGISTVNTGLTFDQNKALFLEIKLTLNGTAPAAYILSEDSDVYIVDDNFKATVDDFGRLQYNEDVAVAARDLIDTVGDLQSGQILSLDITPIVGTTTYKTDGFDSSYTKKKIGAIKLVGPETFVYNTLRNAGV